jgi:hypothetical protein
MWPPSASPWPVVAACIVERDHRARHDPSVTKGEAETLREPGPVRHADTGCQGRGDRHAGRDRRGCRTKIAVTKGCRAARSEVAARAA